MDQKFIDNSSFKEIQKIKKEIEMLQNNILDLKDKIHIIQADCNHIFTETSIMKICQKCGLTESVYY